ncbi:hypothetical protein [Aliifodinibius salipaludis]|uniref:hypothetical protein n=1 Tax=Fodinibius salipaludis TaxID=2032627 RepID=UPI001140C70A|nr:hypothetical protein [Aliifodinibius salipaludis]
MIKINRKILNQLHKDEADIGLLQKRFDERGNQTDEFIKITSEVNADSFTEKEKESLKKLFNRFNQQQQKIQEAFTYILEESKGRLNDAIKTNKAEKSYKLLKR